MREYIPFSTTEQLLLTAISLPGSNIKTIAAATGIQANTLYKWNPPQSSVAAKGRQTAALLYGK